MWDHMPDGSYQFPDSKRKELHEKLKTIPLADLKKAVNEYLDWFDTGRINCFRSTICGHVFYSLGYSANGNFDEFNKLLEIYDAVCREIARRVLKV